MNDREKNGGEKPLRFEKLIISCYIVAAVFIVASCRGRPQFYLRNFRAVCNDECGAVWIDLCTGNEVTVSRS